MHKAILYSLKYYEHQYSRLALIFVLNLSKNIIGVLVPLFFASVINHVITNEYHSSALLPMLLTNALVIILSYISKILDIKTTREINLKVKQHVLNQLLVLPPYKLSRYKLGTLQVLLTSDTMVPAGIVTTLMSTLMSIISLVGTAFVVFLLNWKLALVMLFGYPFTLYINAIYTRKLKVSAYELSVDTDSFVGCVRRIVSNLTDISVQDGKTRIEKLFTEYAYRNKCVAERHIITACNNSACISAIGYLNYCILTCCGIALVIEGDIALGSLVAFNSYSKIFTSALDAIVQVKAHLQPSLVSVDRLTELEDMYRCFQAEDDLRQEIESPAQSVELSSVSVSFPEHTVLTDWSFSFAKGITGIRGRNGSGKTTIMNLLLRNIEPSCGSILFGNMEANTIKHSAFRKRISYVGASKVLYNLTLRENLTLFTDGDLIEDSKISMVLEMVNLLNDIANLPKGLETVINDHIQLSSGQIQKIQIARALLKDSDVLLFDESFSNLDLDTRKKVLYYIKHEYADKVVVIISHNAEDYAICDTIVEI